MSELLKQFPLREQVKRTWNAHTCKFPWTKWLDGNVWKAEKGIDYTTISERFVSALYIRARRDNLKVTVQKYETYVIFQFSSKVSVSETSKIKYNWSKWLDGNVHILQKNIDFKLPISRMQNYCYKVAYSKGIKVTTSVHEGLLTIKKVV